ncbi:uncharacterized protein LOC144704220 isoform X3 [Wolffia australiana]
MAKGDTDEEYELFPELLSFAARAQALIAEVLAVSEKVPPAFFDRRFDPILFDLRYIENPDSFESRIKGNRDLLWLEDEIRESCSTFLHRFFILLNDLAAYHEELVRYVTNLQEGLMRFNLEKILENESGMELLAEALAIFGISILLMEHRMTGFLREKLLVAHLRLNCTSDCLNLENISKLCRLHRRSYSSYQHNDLSSFVIVVQNPEELLARSPFPKEVVETIIYRIKDGNLNRCLKHYPDPQHRTVALSRQAGLLYVLLLYCPEFLHNGFLMREIVDKFFRDCWVCPIFLYFCVDLSVSWDAYKEAKTALTSYLPFASISDRAKLSCTKVKEVNAELDMVLSDGVLTKSYVLKTSHHLISLVRTCNVFMRWTLLHKSSLDKKLRDIVTSSLTSHQISDESLFLLILKISWLEFQVRCFYSKLLEEKEASWNRSKSYASAHMKELSHFFSGTWAAAYKLKDDNLDLHFGKLLLEVCSLDYLMLRKSENNIYSLVSALKELEKIHQISDSSYAWSYIDNFLELFKRMIEKDSSLALNSHCFILKFSKLLVSPISRISQSKRVYLKYKPSQYRDDYASRVESILSFLTGMIFAIFNEDISHHLLSPESPIYGDNVNMDYLHDDSLSRAQFSLIEAVNKVSILSKELHLMSKNLSCLLELDVKKWLEGQISKELLRQLGNKSRQFFTSTAVEPEGFQTSLKKFNSFIHSQYRLVECLQDIIHLRGNLIWDQVLSEFFKDSAQQEACSFLTRSEASVYVHNLNDFSTAQTFIGRMINQTLHLTSPSRSMFVEPMSGWFNLEGRQLFGLHDFELIRLCLGAAGLASLDSLMYCAIKVNLENVLMGMMNVIDERVMDELQKTEEALGHVPALPSIGFVPYQPVLKMFDASCHSWAESLATLGQLQLLRHMVSLKPNASTEVMNKGETSIRQNPYGEVYICKEPPPFISRCMSIMTISQLAQYVFDPHLGTLICQTKKATDFLPLIIGLGTFINQFHRKHMITYLQQMGQYVRTLAANDGAPGIDLASEVTKSTFWLMSFCKIMRIPKDLLDSFLMPSLISVLQT